MTEQAGSRETKPSPKTTRSKPPLAGEIHFPIGPPRSDLAVALSFRNRARSLTRSQRDETWESTVELQRDEKRSWEAILIAMAMKFMRE